MTDLAHNKLKNTLKFKTKRGVFYSKIALKRRLSLLFNSTMQSFCLVACAFFLFFDCGGYKMQIEISTAAVLFPAISLILLAYTNRFLALASLIRHLCNDYQRHKDRRILAQIDNIKVRIILIKWMQFLGVATLVVCVMTMGLVFSGHVTSANWCFLVSLILMLASLCCSLVELHISAGALEILLIDLEKD